MAFTVTNSTLGAKAARLITGSGNLTDLATALATHGVTMVGTTLLFSGTGADTYYRIDGALTEQRLGVWNVRIGAQSCVCFAGNGGTTILGLRDVRGNITSAVNIVALTTRFAVGGDRFMWAEYECHIGSGTYRQYGGSIWYENCAAGRSDFDLWQNAASITLDGVILGFNAGTSYSHIFTSAHITTLGGTHIQTGSAPAEAGVGAAIVYSFSTNAGLRFLYGSAGFTWNLYQPMFSIVDHYTTTTNQIYINIIDGVNRYYNAGGAGETMYNNMRLYQTLRATFKDTLGVAVSTPTPKLVSVLPDTTTSVSNYSAGAATYQALQATHAALTAYSAAGVGWTSLGNYSFYSVGYGYAAKYENVNVGTAFVGITGVPWSAVSAKSPLCVTPYASVVTAGFSLDTGTNTLTISASATTDQAAEYLFKHAYDNPELAYWRTRSHTPATPDGDAIDFMALNIVVTGAGVVLSGSKPITSGSISTNSGGSLALAAYQTSSGLFVALSVSSIVSGSRVQLYNVTDSSEIYNAVVSGTSYSQYIEYTSDKSVRLRATKIDGVTAKAPFETIGTLTVSGLSFTANQVECPVYDAYGIDGSTVTGFTADYIDDEVDLTVATNFYLTHLFAWWCYNLTTAQGISEFFGGITPVDEGNIQVNDSIVSIYLDNLTATEVWALDNRRFFRTDGTRPVRSPTTGGGGIDVEWREPVLFVNDADIAAIKAKTDNLPSDPADQSLVEAAISAAQADMKGADDRDLTEVYNNTPSIDPASVWNYDIGTAPGGSYGDKVSKLPVGVGILGQQGKTKFEMEKEKELLDAVKKIGDDVEELKKKETVIEREIELPDISSPIVQKMEEIGRKMKQDMKTEVLSAVEEAVSASIERDESEQHEKEAEIAISKVMAEIEAEDMTENEAKRAVDLAIREAKLESAEEMAESIAKNASENKLLAEENAKLVEKLSKLKETLA